MCLIIMIVVCIKQHLSNIWRSVHDKVKQHRLEKRIAYKKICFCLLRASDPSRFIESAFVWVLALEKLWLKWALNWQ